jgi:hypothetical protein
MKKLVLLFALVGTLIIHAQTTIPGGSVYGTWPLSGSPYNVQGSIMIPNDSTLTIQPGVTVNFLGTYQFLILGKLIAIGTSADTITFTAANKSAGWTGIRFDNTTTNNDTSRITFCKIQYGRATGASPLNHGGGIYFNNVSKVAVSHSRIFNCSANNNGGGLYIYGGNPIINNNTIANDTISQGLGGCGIYIEMGNPVINNNIIYGNSFFSNSGSPDGGGIYLESGSPSIKNNIISYNTGASGGGIHIDNGTPIISDNTITNNYAGEGGGIYIENTGTSATFIISNNILSNNVASDEGGGIKTNRDITITNNTIYNNSGAYG